MFEGTKGDTDLGQVTPGQSQEPGVTQSLKVGNAVTVSYKAEGEAGPAHVVLEWEGSSTSDMVADAVIAIVLQVCSRSSPCRHCSTQTQCLLVTNAFSSILNIASHTVTAIICMPT